MDAVMEPLFELDIALPRRGSRHILQALHAQLKAAVLDGRLASGLRLPSTRTLAQRLGVSRNTAIAAYDLLLGEGYLEARTGSGTFVAANVPRPRQAAPRALTPDSRLNAFWREQPALLATSPGLSFQYDLRLGLPELAHFDAQCWRRLSVRAVRELARQPAIYGPAAGQPALRTAIAGHVAFARAVACEPDDIIVTAGAQQAFDLLARVLVTAGRTVVATEDPGYPPLRMAFAACGARIVPVPVDSEGLRVDRLPADVDVVCVTPSHQYPTGVALSAARRSALLAVARARNAVVIEDDYDGEFRFGGRPLDALQTLDRAGSVFYVGTFSKSLFPALRIGFVVAPPWARPALLSARQLMDWHVPILAQETLAAFIAEGHLARHVRKMRSVYEQRRRALLAALERYAGNRIKPIPGLAGLHLAARLDSHDADRLAAGAAATGIGLETLSRYADDPASVNGIAMSYGTIAVEAIDGAIRRLAECLGACRT